MFPDDNELPALAKVDRSPYRHFYEDFPWRRARRATA
jgi:hypothetical protein